METRQTQFKKLFPNTPSFRWSQIEEALFQPEIKTWNDITSLPKETRQKLEDHVPFVTYKNQKVFISQKADTHKAMLEMEDGNRIETVLMENQRGNYTICVSSQVGCAMKCGFCATGKMGLKRNLTFDEIADQYRFWRYYLQDRTQESKQIKSPSPDKERVLEFLPLPRGRWHEVPEGVIAGRERSGGNRISNVVFMGMGEPLANFENVKQTLHTWLSHTDLGPTHITVSTVGLLPLLDQIINDPTWPHVRLAVSLHSADPITRKEIVPTTAPNFMHHFETWARTYLKKFGNRKHHLTFEYVMLRDVNDTIHHAKTLATLIKKLGQIKVNLIPYNFTDGIYNRSLDTQIQTFKKILEDTGEIVTVRKTMGDDIAAACGQLITLNNPKPA